MLNNKTENATVFVMNFLRIGAYLHRIGDRIAGEFGLNQQQFVVLNEIKTSGDIHQKQLVGELLYEKSNISKIIKKLKSQDLIEVFPSPEDKRVTIIKTTSKGEAVWRQGIEKFNAWNINWIKPLTKNEILQTIQILDRLKQLS